MSGIVLNYKKGKSSDMVKKTIGYPQSLTAVSAQVEARGTFHPVLYPQKHFNDCVKRGFWSTSSLPDQVVQLGNAENLPLTKDSEGGNFFGGILHG